MTLSELTSPRGIQCACGKKHFSGIDSVVCRPGALSELPAVARRFGAEKVFILADPNTYAAAGKQVCEILTDAGIGFSLRVFASSRPAPNEETVGSAVMHFDASCGLIVGVGSGVVNDTGKILAHMTGKPYCIVATAPSMDGYASASSSMDRDGLKISLPTVCPNVILGDTDILKNAPLPMLRSGLGDMLAKYVSICEWRIAHLVTGEYYCEYIASLVRSALEKCVLNAEGLLSRDESAVEAVFEGLVIGGLAMSFAGLSRPASGVEHYFSHVWDMRALEFGTPSESHGTQCALATLISARLYERLKTVSPDVQKAQAFVLSFDKEAHFAQLRRLLGKGAEAMIALEAKEQKYSPEKHRPRLQLILSKWDQIVRIIEEELPESSELEALMTSIGLPTDPAELGLDTELTSVFRATKDIRDKYVLTRLLWDLGLIEEFAPAAKKEENA